MSTKSWAALEKWVVPLQETKADKLLIALNLYETGKEWMRMHLMRKYPSANQFEIEERLTKWLLDRPGAEYGDAEGKAVSWPRSNK